MSEKHPGASTIRSHEPLAGDLTPYSWQMRAPSHEPPYGMGEAQAPITLIKQVGKGGGR